MENDDQELIAQTLSIESGNVAALTAAVVGVLQALRNNPAVVDAVNMNMEIHYSSELAESQNPYFLQGFEHTRDYLLAMLK